MNFLKKYNYQLILLSLVSLVLTPLSAEILSVSSGVVGLINYTLVIFACLISAEKYTPKVVIAILGVLVLFLVWREYFVGMDTLISLLRMYALLAMFCTLLYILIYKIINAEIIDLKVIIGAIAGYFLLGFIGGILFEIMNYYQPGRIMHTQHYSGFDFYYFSFISLVTVGYGDIVPVSPAAKSLTIILSLVGQFYLTIGIALFVGKHLYQSSKTE